MKSLFPGKSSWTPLVGYEGVYWINTQGQIKNARNHVLKPLDSTRIELRGYGQRKVHLINHLLEKTFGGK